ncbi:MAG: PTS sugar transporter subunit IIA [Candidatus Omnitrophica bacterium]|nr:PTS sugar transporter subunit IIA [Candidatus Omnitrophota bacterium]
MKVSELLKKNLIKLEIEAVDKQGVIKEMVDIMRDCAQIENGDVFLNDVYAREKLGSTGIGDGIALPHARSKGIKQLILVFGRSTEGVEFDALDGNPVHLVFLIGTPKEDVGNYLKTLAQLSRLLKKEHFRKRILAADSEEEIFEIFKEAEEQ